MSCYRLAPTPGQEAALRRHCAHARYVWNLAVEQHSWLRPGRGRPPGYLEQARQLTQARRDNPWLAAGSQTIRFRWSRPVPEGVRSYRVRLDAAGRWHVAFAAIPGPIPAPGTGEIVGVDRGVAVSAALSTGELLTVPRLSPQRRARLVRLQKKLARAKRGSNRRARTRRAIARLRAREADTRKDWAEKASTDLARQFDLIRVEDLRITNMTRSARGTLAAPGVNVRQKAGLNREILRSGWGLLVQRLEQKAPGRVEKIHPAFTSQRCSACGHVDGKSRKSQAGFACIACGFACNADVNAARNIAAGHAVTARGGLPPGGPANREPHLLPPSA